MVLYFVRHFKPQVDPGICYGSSDLKAEPLRHEVLELAQNLTSASIIYSSPLARCFSLASSLANVLGLETVVFDSLRELHFGNWELKPWDEIGPEALDGWIRSGYEAIHQGESLKDFDYRVSEWIRSLQGTPDAIVVTHAGVIRSVLRSLGTLTLDESLALPIDFGEVLIIEVSS